MFWLFSRPAAVATEGEREAPRREIEREPREEREKEGGPSQKSAWRGGTTTLKTVTVGIWNPD